MHEIDYSSTMVTVDDFSRLVANVYAAAVEPTMWDVAIKDLHQTLGGSCGGLATAQGPIWSIEDSTLPGSALTSYADYYCQRDIVMELVSTGPVGAIRTGAEVLRPNRNTEIFRDWVVPNKMGDDAMFVRLTTGPAPSCLIINGPMRDHDFATPERIKVMSSLVVHFQQALRVREGLAGLQQTNNDLLAALDALRHAVVVVAPDGVVATLNGPAEDIVRAGDGIGISSGRIVAVAAGRTSRIQRAVKVASGGDATGIRSSTTMRCARPSGRRPFTLHVLPLHRTDGLLAPRGALVVVIDPEAGAEPETAHVRRTLGLTSAEAEVAVRLARGTGLRDIADELSVSLTTVRTHLQHVFTKTDTHRQAELVRLLLGLGR